MFWFGQMTGLDPKSDTIMSVACILTTADLQPLDPAGFEVVIRHTPEQLARMSEWCVRTHGASGLTRQCLASTTTAEVAADTLLRYVEHFIPEPGRALLAGNSVHADRSFLAVAPWDVVLRHLHYRLLDVSAVKEMVRRWAGPDVLAAAPRKMNRHTAREDILESVEEARFYKRLIEGVSLGGKADDPQSRRQQQFQLGPGPGSVTVSGSGLDAREGRGGGGGGGGGDGDGDGDENADHVDGVERTGSARSAKRGDVSDCPHEPTAESAKRRSAGGGGPRHIHLGGGGGGVAGGTLGTKQRHEEADMQRNNGTRAGDVGTLDPGFRTEVP
jgi:oligoribonuclease